MSSDIKDVFCVSYEENNIGDFQLVATEYLVQLAITPDNLGQELGNAVRTELLRRVGNRGF